MESSEGTITVADGVRLYFQKFEEKSGGGSGPVLFPNGLSLAQDFRHLAAKRAMVFYDVRNRGRSQTVTDPAKLALGIQQDVHDLDAVRRYFGIDKADVIGHSYIGLMVGLYAMQYPEHTGRLVQIGPMQPDASKQYPPHLMNADGTLAEVMSRIAALSKVPPAGDPEEMCRNFWRVLRLIYVTNPKDAERIDWGRCELENERAFGAYWLGQLLPSIQKLQLQESDFKRAVNPVLVVHGTKDRSAPYGGGRDWAHRFPDARLATVPDGGHAPWIEAPDLVFESMETFLDGEWPVAAEKLVAVDIS